LTLSRDLSQTDETSGALELIGQTLRDMIRPDSALLLLRGDRLNIVGVRQPRRPLSSRTILQRIHAAC